MVEPFLHRVYYRSDWSGTHLNQINVFRITCPGEIQFEKSCSAPECEVLCEIRVTEYLDQGSGDDKVLFNLGVLRPGHPLAPLSYIG